MRGSLLHCIAFVQIRRSSIHPFIHFQVHVLRQYVRARTPRRGKGECALHYGPCSTCLDPELFLQHPHGWHNDRRGEVTASIHMPAGPPSALASFALGSSKRMRVRVRECGDAGEERMERGSTCMPFIGAGVPLVFSTLVRMSYCKSQVYIYLGSCWFTRSFDRCWSLGCTKEKSKICPASGRSLTTQVSQVSWVIFSHQDFICFIANVR